MRHLDIPLSLFMIFSFVLTAFTAGEAKPPAPGRQLKAALAPRKAPGDDVRISIGKTIQLKGPNKFYAGNRQPLLPSALMKLPPGAVRPDTWLRRQMDLMADGFSGRLTEISKWCKFEGSAWADPKAVGQYGWEELPYWLKGYIDLGYILADKRIIAESKRWVESVLRTQEKDGYFGPRINRERHDIWPNMLMLSVLRTYYEATGDKRIIPFFKNYFRWLTTIPLEEYLPGSWQKWRGGDNLDHIYWLYNQTGEPWLLELARTNHERTADWTGGIPTWHGVNVCQGFREPAEYYQQSHDIRYLAASERNYDSVMNLYGQVPGGMFGADENCRTGYSGPRQGAETCSIVEFMHSFEMLLAITGDQVWAERCEEVAFNSLPAAMTADLKALHYLTASNQVKLDTVNKAPMVENDGDMFSYNPWQYRCCQHNVAFGWPYFTENLWMATPGNGLAATLYAPSAVKARAGDGTEVTILEETGYPFAEGVKFRFLTFKPVTFPLTIRIPDWCSGAKLSLNGRVLKEGPRLKGWVTLERRWANNDELMLELPMTVRVKVWEKNANAISVHRGPLVYSLKIGERWERYGSSEKWPGYQVYPTGPWNYGLLIEPATAAAAFQVTQKSMPGDYQPFTPDAAPLELKVKAKKIPRWQMEANGMVGEIQPSPVSSGEATEDITLIPMGCARLRIAAFPWIGEGPEAHTWK